MPQGSVREKRPGRWELRVGRVSRMWPYDGSRNASKRKAQTALAALVTEVGSATTKHSPQGTFGDLVKRWLANVEHSPHDSAHLRGLYQQLDLPGPRPDTPRRANR
jgi:hypothetical protein